MTTGGMTENYLSTGAPSTVNFTRNRNLNNNSAIGELAFGYGKFWQSFYLGSEAFVDIDHFQTSNAENFAATSGGVVINAPLSLLNSARQNNNVKLSSAQYGVDLRPGFLANSSTLVYGIVGIAETKAILNSSFTAKLGTSISASNANPQKSKFVSGSRLGFGAAHAIAKHWTVDLDYIFTTYGSLKSKAVTYAADSGVVTDQEYTNSVKARVYTNAVMMGLAYQFSSGNGKDEENLLSDYQNLNFDGAYFSLGLGGMRATSGTAGYLSSSTISGLNAPVTAPTYINESSNLNANNVLGSAALGYGKTWQRFYAGADVFVDADNIQFRYPLSYISNSTSSATFEQTNKIRFSPLQYGFDFRPGYLIDPTDLIYGRVGLAEAKVTLYSSYLDTLNNREGANPTASRHLNGLRLGFGLAHSIVKHWQVTADYIYTTYGSVNSNTTGRGQPVTTDHYGAPAAYQYQNTLRSRLYTNTVLLGVLYQF